MGAEKSLEVVPLIWFVPEIFTLTPVVENVAMRLVKLVPKGTVTLMFVPVKIVCTDVGKRKDVISLAVFEATSTVTIKSVEEESSAITV